MCVGGNLENAEVAKIGRYVMDGLVVGKGEAGEPVLALEDGTVYEGPTRVGARGAIKVYDIVNNKHREFGLGVIKEIDCEVVKEWYEKPIKRDPSEFTKEK